LLLQNETGVDEGRNQRSAVWQGVQDAEA